jgi:sterol desaturase/sphingolipid hydroxylase (fatty acid hydroxylase superfamily)
VDEEVFQLVRAGVFVAALALVVILERSVPHARLRPAWRTNLALWASSAGLVGLLCGACACTVARWASQGGVGLLNSVSTPGVAGVALTIVALDGVSYAWHRANHRIPFLWRFHRVHHRDEAFSVSTALRFHPGEILLSLPLRLTAILVLGAPVAGVLAFEALFMCANLLEHGNFDLPRRAERSLSNVVVTPALHRWHHSREPSELDTNFGTVLTLWDRALGTFHANGSETEVATGLHDVERDWRSLRDALVDPLRGGVAVARET